MKSVKLNRAYVHSILLASALAAMPSLRAAEVIFSDDLSTLDHFMNKTVAIALWETDGANAVYNQNGGGGGARACLISSQDFKFKDGGPVIFEFTTTFYGLNSRFEVGLLDAAAAAGYGNPIVIHTIYGFSLIHTDHYSEAGLLYNPGTRPAPGAGAAASISMSALEGSRRYKIVFMPSGTELFRDDVLIGRTDQTLDFSRRYKIAVYGQLRDEKSLDQISLSQ